MARITKKLTDTEIKKATKTLYDGNGLMLTVTKTGRKFWRLKYKWNGKDQKRSLGEYPVLTLKAARTIRQKALVKLLEKQHPFDEEACSVDEYPMRKYVKEYMLWLEKNRSTGHFNRVDQAFTNDVLPTLGNEAMGAVTQGDIIKVVKTVSDRGAKNSAQKLFSGISHFYSYLVVNYPDQFDTNICTGLKISFVVGKPEVTNYAAAITPESLSKVLKAIGKGDSSVSRALELLPHVAVRPANIRSMEWKDINLSKKIWTIPKEKMKNREEHIVPLSKQVIKMLKSWDRESNWVFPSPMHPKSMLHPLSINRGLSRLKIGFKVVPHGFRSSFSTLVREYGDFSEAAIEMQLSHSLGSKVSKAYNRSKLMKERVRLMQWYSDLLEGYLK